MCNVSEADFPKGKPLAINFDNLFSSDDDDEEPPEIVIVKDICTPSPATTATDSSMEGLTDCELEQKIKRLHFTIRSTTNNLIDKGEKLRQSLERMEKERERRKEIRANSVVDEAQKVAPKTFGTFGSIFNRRMTDERNPKIGNAFDKEVGTMNPRGQNNVRSDGGFFRRERQTIRLSPRKRPLMFTKTPYPTGDRRVSPKRKESSIRSLQNSRLNPVNLFAKSSKEDFRLVKNDQRRRKEETAVVLLDDDDDDNLDEPEPLKGPSEELNKISELLKNNDAKIYYPSRDDPEAVEITFGDMDCLGPEAFLRSPVINFYIRYIQQHATPKHRGCEYHVFSTYFYKKLKEAVAYKGDDKDAFFLKFRRWWKGVNIFQKAYVLIPIHDDLHWSLVIICIPEYGELEPIILHLDSLGLHRSKPIFNNVRSFMKAEWNYLNQEEVDLDLPISDEVWKKLPDIIYEQKIPVPQQRNDYDCGLFVLYFMERFIEEAPERLKKEDLAMFGKQWFKPEEASGLREKIREILMEEFQISLLSESASPELGDE